MKRILNVFLFALVWTFTLISYGVAIHDYSHHVWELRGTVFSLEGGYVGFIILGICLFLIFLSNLNNLRKSDG